MKRGYIFSIVSAVLFGSAGLVVKLAYVEGIDPISLLTLQYIIAVAVMFGVLLIKNRKAIYISRNDMCKLIVLGVIGNTTMTVFYYLSYRFLPMAMVTILLYTYPIVVYIYSLQFEKSSINIKKTAALMLAFTGCVFALGLAKGEFKYSAAGMIFGLLAAVFYAFMNIYSEKKLYHVDALVINAYSTLFSLVSLVLYKFPFFLLKGEVSFNLISYTAVLAIFCEIIPLTLMYAALKRIGSLKVSIIGNIETPTAMFLSFFILREHITLIQVLGAILVFYSVYLLRK